MKAVCGRRGAVICVGNLLVNVTLCQYSFDFTLCVCEISPVNSKVATNKLSGNTFL